jgi:hypothetical protein
MYACRSRSESDPQGAEWFTIGRDPVGEPIQRRLREMAADDVLASLDWYLQD